MEKAVRAIRKVAEETERAVLFHSASGKDSIALLDLMHPYFKEIVCVYMYIIPSLEHIGRYINWALKKYPKTRFIQIPHYALYSCIKQGFMGCKKNPKQRQWSLAELTDKVRERTGIEWAFFGFKKSDGLNRRLMLMGYEDECLNRMTRKCYPLSSYLNKDVLSYIEHNNLIRPEQYGGEHQSSSTNIADIHYQLYLKEKYPNDLKRLYSFFPMAEKIMFDYETERNDRNQKVAD